MNDPFIKFNSGGDDNDNNAHICRKPLFWWMKFNFGHLIKWILTLTDKKIHWFSNHEIIKGGLLWRGGGLSINISLPH